MGNPETIATLGTEDKHYDYQRKKKTCQYNSLAGEIPVWVIILTYKLGSYKNVGSNLRQYC